MTHIPSSSSEADCFLELSDDDAAAIVNVKSERHTQKEELLGSLRKLTWINGLQHSIVIM